MAELVPGVGRAGFSLSWMAGAQWPGENHQQQQQEQQ